MSAHRDHASGGFGFLRRQRPQERLARPSRHGRPAAGNQPPLLVGGLACGLHWSLVMERAEAETCTYHVTKTAHGFLARCRDLDVGVEGATVSMAIEALRSAITKH